MCVYFVTPKRKLPDFDLEDLFLQSSPDSWPSVYRKRISKFKMYSIDCGHKPEFQTTYGHK